MSTLNEEILRLKNAKAAIDEVLIARGVSIPENATLDTYNELINSIQGGTSSEEVTATKANVLAGTTTITADSNDEIVEGTMPNNGGQTVSLNCGESYTILEGYHDGTGIITANDLASQTVGTAIASDIINGQHAWVNGEEIVGSLQLTGNAGVAQVLSGATFYNTNAKEIQTGSMPNNGAVAPSALGAGGSYTIPAGYHNGSGKVTVQSLATMTASGDATAAHILSGKKAYVDGNLITGNMTDRGAQTPSALNCGGSYTIPAGYHNGSGKVTANSLSSQTGVDSGKYAVTAAYMLTGYQGWVNGSKISGTMSSMGAQTKTITPSRSAQTYTIPAGYHNGSGKVTVSAVTAYKTGSVASSTSKSTQFTATSGYKENMYTVTIPTGFNVTGYIVWRNDTYAMCGFTPFAGDPTTFYVQNEQNFSVRNVWKITSNVNTQLVLPFYVSGTYNYYIYGY